MSVIQDLASLSAAEDFFDYLAVPYSPDLLRVNRLHIMRQLGNLLRDEALRSYEGDEVALRAMLRERLTRAYDDLANEGPLSRRLFKVHQDAVRPKETGPLAAFVPLSALVGPLGSDEP